MKNIESVTALVNCLFSAYNQSIQGLDWEEKITEYSDVIDDFISYDTDLNELYLQIRQTFSNLPQPSAIKKMLSKTKTKAEIRDYKENPDNGKLLLLVCYRSGELKEIREYIVANDSADTTHLKDIKIKLKDRFDDIKVREYCKGSSLIGNKVFIPMEYDSEGNCIKQYIEEIA